MFSCIFDRVNHTGSKHNFLIGRIYAINLPQKSKKNKARDDEYHRRTTERVQPIRIFKVLALTEISSGQSSDSEIGTRSS